MIFCVMDSGYKEEKILLIFFANEANILYKYFVSYLMGFKVSNRYLLVIKYDISSHDVIVKKLKSLKKFKVRSKSIFKDQVELSLELDLKENKKGNIDSSIVDDFSGVDGVINASLIAYQNDFGD